MIGKTIKQIRHKKGCSILNMDKISNVSKSYLSKIERGLQTNPSIHFLRKMSSSLNINIEILLNNVKPNNSMEMELDAEWREFITQAIKGGLKKEDVSKGACLLRHPLKIAS